MTVWLWKSPAWTFSACCLSSRWGRLYLWAHQAHSSLLCAFASHQFIIIKSLSSAFTSFPSLTSFFSLRRASCILLSRFDFAISVLFSFMLFVLLQRVILINIRSLSFDLLSRPLLFLLRLLQPIHRSPSDTRTLGAHWSQRRPSPLSTSVPLCLSPRVGLLAERDQVSGPDQRLSRPTSTPYWLYGLSRRR